LRIGLFVKAAMSVDLPQLGHLAEIRGMLQSDRSGQVLAATPGVSPLPQDEAAAAAAALGELALAGEVARLGRLLVVSARGVASVTVTAARSDALLVIHADPAGTTAPVEAEARRWASGAPAQAPPDTVEPPRPATARRDDQAGWGPDELRSAGRGRLSPLENTDPWAALRRALARSHLVEATTLRQALCASVSAAPGAEATAREACDRALRVLCEGVGSVMAGDGLGGGRILRPLTGEDQPNLTFRWLALHWSARAALRCGSVPAARAHVQASLTLARELDVEARALSQWTAAEVLSHDRDPAKALAWLAESRARFERSADAWGVGQTWLSEARLHAASGRARDAAEAARHAAEALPGSEEPQVALARIALLEDDVAGADARLRPLRTQAAERLRTVVAALRGGLLPRAEAIEYLREQEATPSLRALSALGRIATAAPRFPQARETLAWMLLRVGRAEEAATHLRWLLSQPLSPAERASVTLGLGCVANAQRPPATPAPTRTPPPSATPAPAAVSGPPMVRMSGGADAVFSGQLGSFALADLLEFLRSGRRTGLLVCSSAAGLGRLRFRDGRITAGGAPATPGLGELLVRGGAVGAAVIAAAGPADDADPLAEGLAARLVRGGLAGSNVVAAALEQRVTLAVRELVGWTDGEFAFTREGAGAAETAVDVALDPQGVLLEIFKELDEQSRTAAADASA
jgi:tetratricopeptide (TPR) repeat protein